jgi:tetratricopeptide (TPR) repeat protein
MKCVAIAVTLFISGLMLAPKAFADDWDICAGKDIERAIDFCTKIIKSGRETKKNTALAYRNRGVAYARKGELRQALADQSAAIEHDRRLAEAYYDRGLTYYNLHNAKAAIEDYSVTISLKPAFASAYGNRGLAYLILGDLERALVDLNKAVKLDPKNGINYFNRADAFEKSGDLKKAIRDWERAVTLLPTTGKWRTTVEERLALIKAKIEKQESTAPQ